MLPLDSDRWGELASFFGTPVDVARAIAHWREACGFDQELDVYSQELFQSYLHQGTISSVAFAVVPWVVDTLQSRQVRHPAHYLIDVATVELNRLEYGTYYPRGTPGAPPPDWLAADYAHAIQEAAQLAEDLLDTPLPPDERHMLWQLLPALFGNTMAVSERMQIESPEDLD